MENESKLNAKAEKLRGHKMQTQKMRKLSNCANKATIIACGIAVLSLLVAIASLCYTRLMYLDGLPNAGSAIQPIQVAAGVHNGVDAFTERINVQPGDEVLVQMSFRNISGFKMDTVAGRIVLPDALEFVSGSTRVFNRTNPNGVYADDGIAETWVGLGGYSEYDGHGRGSGSVSFRVRVSEDLGLFVVGVNTLNIVCQIGGYIDGILLSDTYIAYVAVDVIIGR